jgi:putative flavoprotein involved in K+ transport
MAGEQDVQAVVIGAGAAGLGAALELRRRGVPAVVLDRAGAVGDRWRQRYEGLRLNNPRSMSGLRGVAISRAAGRWPSRLDYADYLERCAERFGLEVRLGVEATRVDRDGDGYELTTSAGALRARHVVVATGYDRVPSLPKWPGRDGFAGELVHAADYRRAGDYAGRDVLVVGTGNTGTEIATQLAGAGAARVRIAMRTPVNVLPDQVLGLPTAWLGWASNRQPARLADAGGFLLQRLVWGDLSAYGMPRAPMGVGTEIRRKGHGPVVDRGFVDTLRSGRISIVGAVERFDGAEVVLAGDARLRPDVVIAATGYRHGLDDLVGHLGVLLPSGRPVHVDGRAHAAAPGLHFNGYWLPLAGQLHGMHATSRRIARAVARRQAAAPVARRTRRSCVREVVA